MYVVIKPSNSRKKSIGQSELFGGCVRYHNRPLSPLSVQIPLARGYLQRLPAAATAPRTH